MDDFTQIKHRLDSHEKLIGDLNSKVDARDLHTAERFGSLQNEMSGLREQAKAHQEISSKANADLRQKILDLTEKTQELIVKGLRENQQAVDAIGVWLGVEDPKEGKSLRQNLEYLAESRRRREKWRDHFDRAVFGGIVLGAFTVMLLGLKAWFGQ